MRTCMRAYLHRGVAGLFGVRVWIDRCTKALVSRGPTTQVTYHHRWKWFELLPFIIIGVIGGK